MKIFNFYCTLKVCLVNECERDRALNAEIFQISSDSAMVKILGKQIKPSPGFEPGLEEPQSSVLTRLHKLGYDVIYM